MSELEVNNKINLPSYQQKVICEIFLYLPKRYQVKKEHRRKIHNFEIAHVFSSKFCYPCWKHDKISDLNGRKSLFQLISFPLQDFFV